ncbi:AbrB/MazE/SpoVT family DNA-binding domain-containing protein [Olsenella sp. kh2p3]|uniref:AbrB/MazE/SpoVT family DNA-binding domain-containing protein n=1 Tax=Olsenella sp. kh2p3 TaxID=1797112 RepID=UPI00091FA357|nr:AbrB/MazE/SpoVT family DNA-binding domain-containing protein [Olsenella sp. kh2p3]MCI2085394.1 AbrB/MazE/SpoVT family DNA-binding domain-containing protein [Olsenella sp.]SFX48358.1 looped-hinge helix DNA binding domain-containing protein, AbrB family [Olsenella sp. kh2p3]
MQTVFVDSAKVMSKGQVTIPKEVRKVLGVQSGDKVTFVVEGNTVRVMNSAAYAMRVLQREMSDEANRVGIATEDEAVKLVSSMRSEGPGN